jgi:hypothetical protein
MAATTFTVTGQDYIRPYFLGGAGRHTIRTFAEATAGTFLPGEVLIQDTGSHLGGAVKVAANDPTAGVIGIAVHGATGVANTGWAGGVGTGGLGSRTDNTALGASQASSLGPGVGGSLGMGVGGSYVNIGNVRTLQGNGATKGLIQVYLAGQGNVFVARALSGQTISNDDIGAQYGLELDATNLIWRVDNGDTANKVVQIVGLFDNDGDINGRYIFKFVAAANRLFGER